MFRTIVSPHDKLRGYLLVERQFRIIDNHWQTLDFYVTQDLHEPPEACKEWALAFIKRLKPKSRQLMMFKEQNA